MGRPPPKIEALGDALSRLLREPKMLSLSPEGTWEGAGSWTLTEALWRWLRHCLSPVAMANGTHPVLHVAAKLPNCRHYLDAHGLSAHNALLDRLRLSRFRDNPFFMPYDPNFFRFSGLPLRTDVAKTLVKLLREGFGDFDKLL